MLYREDEINIFFLTYKQRSEPGINTAMNIEEATEKVFNQLKIKNIYKLIFSLIELLYILNFN